MVLMRYLHDTLGSSLVEFRPSKAECGVPRSPNVETLQSDAEKRGPGWSNSRERPHPPACSDCSGAREGRCGAFRMDVFAPELQTLKMKKTPGPDGITAEMLLHPGPTSRSTLLHVINAS